MKVAPETDISKCFATAFCFILCHRLTIMWVAKNWYFGENLQWEKTLSCHVWMSHMVQCSLYLLHFHDIDTNNWSTIEAHAKKSVCRIFVHCHLSGYRSKEKKKCASINQLYFHFLVHNFSFSLECSLSTAITRR